MGAQQLSFFEVEEQKSKIQYRDSNGKYATKREADLEKRERRIGFLERQHSIDKRKIEALIAEIHLYKTQRYENDLFNFYLLRFLHGSSHRNLEIRSRMERIFGTIGCGLLVCQCDGRSESRNNETQKT